MTVTAIKPSAGAGSGSVIKDRITATKAAK